MSDTINVKPSLTRGICLAAHHATASLRPQVKFKFKKAPAAKLHESQVKLKHGGVVKVSAVRNPEGSGSLHRKGEPNKQHDGNWACNVVHWTGDVVTRDGAILNPN